ARAAAARHSGLRLAVPARYAHSSVTWRAAYGVNSGQPAKVGVEGESLRPRQSLLLQTFSAIFGTAKKPNSRRHSRDRLGVWRAERSGKLLSECRFLSEA